MFWRKFDKIQGDGIEGGFRYFLTADERLIHFPKESEVEFSAERTNAIAKNMSREIGQPVQMVDR